MRTPTMGLLVLACLGCAGESLESVTPLAISELPKGTWTVSAIDLDRGHFNWDDKEHGMYHTYVIGIECKRASKRITLLYEEQLPDGLTLSIGDKLTVKAQDSDASYDSEWGGGFWIRNLTITKLSL